MILTLPVLAYQLFFVLVLFIASRFGRWPLRIATLGALAWTVTHIFLPPLAILQSAVIIGSFLWFRRRFQGAQSTARGR